MSIVWQIGFYLFANYPSLSDGIRPLGQRIGQYPSESGKFRLVQSGVLRQEFQKMRKESFFDWHKSGNIYDQNTWTAKGVEKIEG